MCMSCVTVSVNRVAMPGRTEVGEADGEWSDASEDAVKSGSATGQCVRRCVRVCAGVYMRLCVCTGECVRQCVRVCVCVYMRLCVCTGECVCQCVRVCVCVYMRLCVCTALSSHLRSFFGVSACCLKGDSLDSLFSSKTNGVIVTLFSFARRIQRRVR